MVAGASGRASRYAAGMSNDATCEGQTAEKLPVRWLVLGLLGFIGILGLIAWITWPTPEPVDLEPARQILRTAGLPGSFEEFAATIEDVPDDDNAALPFLKAGRALSGTDDLLELLHSVNEVPTVAELREHSGDDLHDLKSRLNKAAEEQAAARTAEVAKIDGLIAGTEAYAELQSRFAASGLDMDELDTPLQVAVVRQLLKERRELIDAIVNAPTRSSEASSSFGVNWQDQSVLLFKKELPHLSPQRTLMRLLQIAALQAAANGDVGRSLRIVDAMLDQADALASDAHLYAVMLVATGLDQFTSTTVGDVMRGIADVDVSEPHRLTLLQIDRKLSDEVRFRNAFKQSFRGEAAAGMQVFELFADSEASAREVFSYVEDGPLRLTPDSQRYARLLAASSSVLEAETETEGLDLLNRKTRQSNAADPDELIVSTSFMPSLDHAVIAQARALAARQMARLAIACRLFAADHNGDLPPTLDDLVPKYLDAVPTDPTDDTGLPVRYDPQRAIIWTSGWDNDDDGGVSLADLEAAEPDAPSKQYLGRHDQVVRLRPDRSPTSRPG